MFVRLLVSETENFPVLFSFSFFYFVLHFPKALQNMQCEGRMKYSLSEYHSCTAHFSRNRWLCLGWEDGWKWKACLRAHWKMENGSGHGMEWRIDWYYYTSFISFIGFVDDMMEGDGWIWMLFFRYLGPKKAWMGKCILHIIIICIGSAYLMRCRGVDDAGGKEKGKMKARKNGVNWG